MNQRTEIPFSQVEAGTPLAIANRPTEQKADLTDRPLPPLSRAVELLRIARRTGDRHGVRLFSHLIDRILDAAYTPASEKPAIEATETTTPNVTELRPAPAQDDWTGADYDSYQVLASIGVINPAACVAAARPVARTIAQGRVA